ncbi:hypothetical protein NDU88_007023 [Pleurodeles waltl]|uniref:Secreted protein n=1 Tax=Pleurodeles waltl TaxID=8319 RepID=A0AAV7UMQ0_PLEWA|nr:hypothetical protein NDU88_007023 [Pleurodeles waltl]
MFSHARAAAAAWDTLRTAFFYVTGPGQNWPFSSGGAPVTQHWAPHSALLIFGTAAFGSAAGRCDRQHSPPSLVPMGLGLRRPHFSSFLHRLLCRRFKTISGLYESHDDERLL